MDAALCGELFCDFCVFCGLNLNTKERWGLLIGLRGRGLKLRATGIGSVVVDAEAPLLAEDGFRDFVVAAWISCG